jgi:hypothetical protein
VFNLTTVITCLSTQPEIDTILAYKNLSFNDKRFSYPLTVKILQNRNPKLSIFEIRTLLLETNEIIQLEEEDNTRFFNRKGKNE